MDERLDELRTAMASEVKPRAGFLDELLDDIVGDDEKSGADDGSPAEPEDPDTGSATVIDLPQRRRTRADGESTALTRARPMVGWFGAAAAAAACVIGGVLLIGTDGQETPLASRQEPTSTSTVSTLPSEDPDLELALDELDMSRAPLEEEFATLEEEVAALTSASDGFQTGGGSSASSNGLQTQSASGSGGATPARSAIDVKIARQVEIERELIELSAVPVLAENADRIDPDLLERYVSDERARIESQTSRIEARIADAEALVDLRQDEYDDYLDDPETACVADDADCEQLQSGTIALYEIIISAAEANLEQVEAVNRPLLSLLDAQRRALDEL